MDAALVSFLIPLILGAVGGGFAGFWIATHVHLVALQTANSVARTSAPAAPSVVVVHPPSPTAQPTAPATLATAAVPAASPATSILASHN